MIITQGSGKMPNWERVARRIGILDELLDELAPETAELNRQITQLDEAAAQIPDPNQHYANADQAVRGALVAGTELPDLVNTFGDAADYSTRWMATRERLISIRYEMVTRRADLTRDAAEALWDALDREVKEVVQKYRITHQAAGGAATAEQAIANGTVAQWQELQAQGENYVQLRNAQAALLKPDVVGDDVYHYLIRHPELTLLDSPETVWQDYPVSLCRKVITIKGQTVNLDAPWPTGHLDMLRWLAANPDVVPAVPHPERAARHGEELETAGAQMLRVIAKTGRRPGVRVLEGADR